MLAFLKDWKRIPFVGVVGVLGALGTVVMGPYLWVRKVRYVLADPEEFVWDFSYFYRAAERFVTDPLTLYADPDYFYPPPSVIAFVPWLAFPEARAYTVAVFVNVLLMAACGLLAVRLWERHAGTVSVGACWAAVLFVLASAPTFQAMKYAQVGPLVLLIGLVALHWLDRRPVASGLALAAGFWLKLYPLALVPLGLLRRGRVRFAAGVALGLVVLPLLLLPVVPSLLYAEYVRDRVPVVRSTTSTYALNQSLPAALERALRSDAAALDNRAPAVLHAGVRVANAVVGIGLFSVVFLAAFRERLRIVPAGFMVLALLPLVSNFGWEHSYVLALPLVQAAFLIAADHPRWRMAAGLVVACFLFPMLPRVVLEALVSAELRPLTDLLLVRFPLAAAVAAFVLARYGGTREARAVSVAEV